MKRFIYLFLIALSPAFVYGQQATTTTAQAFTLDQCIQYALENSVAIKNAGLDQDIAAAKVKETIGIGLPQVTGSANVTANPKLARFFGTYSTASGGISFFPTGIPGAQNGDVLAAQNFFQLKNSGDANITVNQILFNGSYIVGLQASKSYKDLSFKAAGQTKEQTISQVTKAYYLAVINNERINLYAANIARVDTLLRNTKVMAQNGMSEQIDVDRAQVTYNNLITDREKFINIQAVAVELLKFQMNYPGDENIVINGKISDFPIPSLADIDPTFNYDQRWDYQVVKANQKLQELDLKNKHAAGIPSLVAFGTSGYSTQSNTIGGVFKTNSEVKDGGGVGPDKWYNYSRIGVNLTIPIFSGLQRNYQVQQSKLNLLKTENNAKQLESAINLEIRQTRLNFDNALKTLTTQKSNMDLASNVARVTKIKYEQGVGSSLEVITAESSLREAQINYYNAVYDAMLTKVDIDKAYGRILPVTK